MCAGTWMINYLLALLHTLMIPSSPPESMYILSFYLLQLRSRPQKCTPCVHSKTISTFDSRYQSSESSRQSSLPQSRLGRQKSSSIHPYDYLNVLHFLILSLRHQSRYDLHGLVTPHIQIAVLIDCGKYVDLASYCHIFNLCGVTLT